MWSGARYVRVAVVVAMLIVYALAFEWAGFLAATFALLLTLMLFIDPVRIPLVVAIATLAPLAIWSLVTKWLKIQLPAGLLAPWLG